MLFFLFVMLPHPGVAIYSKSASSSLSSSKSRSEAPNISAPAKRTTEKPTAIWASKTPITAARPMMKAPIRRKPGHRNGHSFFPSLRARSKAPHIRSAPTRSAQAANEAPIMATSQKEHHG